MFTESQFLNRIDKKRILVIGDVMLDVYFDGDVKRISPEAPVPVFRKKSERCVPGGAGNVALNLIVAGQDTSIAGVTGGDADGEKLRLSLSEQGIDTEMLFKGNRKTTTKTRFMADGHQQVLRLDIEDTDPVPDADSADYASRIEEHIDKGDFDLVLLSDYNKGFLTGDFTRRILETCRNKGVKALVDVKDREYSKYSGAYLLKPNRRELQDMTGMPVDSDDAVKAASEYLRKETGCTYVLTTCGPRGMVLTGDGCFKTLNAVSQEVFDVTGAGDTTLAYLAVCMANGMDIAEAMEISNYAAGIQVTKVGTSAVKLREVAESLGKGNRTADHKLIERLEIPKLKESVKGKKIVFTNGCFDILHAGHVRYLNEAAGLGDILILGLNSDDSVRRLKGEGRPVNNEKDRAEVLCSLSAVDYVVVFDEDTPHDLIAEIQPDILVKGADYRDREVVGRDIVEAKGGRVELIDYFPGHSTTETIEKLRK